MSRSIWDDDDAIIAARDAFRNIPIEDLRRYLALAAAQASEGDEEDEEDDEGFAPSDDEDFTFFPPAGPHGKWYEQVEEPTPEGNYRHNKLQGTLLCSLPTCMLERSCSSCCLLIGTSRRTANACADLLWLRHRKRNREEEGGYSS